MRALFVTATTTPPPPRAPARIATTRAKPQPIATDSLLDRNLLLADLGPALNLRFASATSLELTTTAFTGPAVKPLPILR